MNNAYDRYRQQVVTTMTQGEMLQKLYDEALRQMDLARGAIDGKDIPAMAEALEKAARILQYLRSVLDFRFEVAKYLARLYEFFLGQLHLANIKKSVKILDDITPLVRELRETFAECDRLDRTSRVSVSTRSAV